MSGERPVTAEAANAKPVHPPTNDPAVVSAEAGAIPPAETPAAAVPVPEAGATVIPRSESATAIAPAEVTAEGSVVAPVVTPARRRLLAVLAGLTRVLRFALVLAIFGVGVAIGYQSFLGSQPLPTGALVDPATAGNQPTPVVRELVAAIARDDADGIRSAVPATPYKSLASEMARWEFQEVTSVETLATYEDGARTATAFVMIGRDSNGNPVAINLIVETDASNIVTFR